MDLVKSNVEHEVEQLGGRIFCTRTKLLENQVAIAVVMSLSDIVDVRERDDANSPTLDNSIYYARV